MTKTILPMLLVTAAFGVANAAETAQTEFFYQPAAGAMDVTPFVGYTMVTTKPQAGGTDTKATGFNLGGKFAYGIADGHAIEATLTYANLETDTTPKVKLSGLTDLGLSYKGTMPMSFGNLRFGIDSTLGFQKGKTESSGDRNLMTGSYAFAPYIGADLAAGPGTVGAKVGYEVLKTNEVSENAAGVESKTKGGADLTAAVFYEMPIADMLLGADFTFVNTGKTENADTGAAGNEAHSTMGFDLYSRIPLMPNAVLLPKVTYAMAKDIGAGASKDDQNTLNIEVGARFAF